MDRYELSDRQDASARHHVRWSKALYASLFIGAIFLMLPHAVPWFSSGVPTTAMGRPIGSTVTFRSTPFLSTAGLHLLLAICYGWIIAVFIYRLHIRMALFIGSLVGLGLYGLNFLLFRMVLEMPPVNEAPVLFTHLFFSLIFAGAYKGISIPDADRISNGNQSE
jgi:hypothetical protein